MKLLCASGLARYGTGLLVALAVSAFAAGCGSSYSAGNGGSGCGIYGCPATMPPAGTDCSASAAGPNVTIFLYSALSACNDKTYTSVSGFSLDNAHSQVIKIPVNSNVTFTASVGGPYTADLLGSSFPGTDTNPGVASPAGTDISAANFSTGSLATGASSAVYHAAVVGVYYFGDHTRYMSGMRSVLIVH